MSDTKNIELSQWDKISSNIVFESNFFKILRCKFKNSTRNKIGNFFLEECNDWVQVLAETKEKHYVLVKQYRFGSGSITLELQGGIMEDGEDPIDAAKRELSEETGYVGDSAELISTLYPNPAKQTNVVNFVLIRNCQKKEDTNFDEFEELQTLIFSREEIFSAIKNGEITHCIPIAGIMKFFMGKNI